MEIWKNIVGYEGLYQVSDLGNIMSLEKYIDDKSSDIQYRPSKVLKQYKSKFGYMRVYLYRNNIRKMYAVHRLVATAFIIQRAENPDALASGMNAANSQSKVKSYSKKYRFQQCVSPDISILCRRYRKWLTHINQVLIAGICYSIIL